MSLNIVNVSITRNTSTGERAVFGIPLFITETVPAGFTERTRSYSSLEEMTDDGFAITDNAYIAGEYFFSQNPNVSELIIGRKDVGDLTWVDALVAIREENDEWFVLTTETRTVADVLALAGAIEALPKMYFVADDTADSIDTVFTTGVSTDLFAQLKDLGYEHTVTYWHDTAATEFVECAFAGHNLPFEAGVANWAYLTLIGVASAKNTDGNELTTTQQNNLLARNANYSTTSRGRVLTYEGKVVSGEYIDIIRGVFSLQENLEGQLFDLLTNQKGSKVPYDDSGLNAVYGAIDEVLYDFVQLNFIQPNYKITVPRARDISVTDKANRILKGVTFEAFLVGAINTVDPLNGNVTYEGQ